MTFPTLAFRPSYGVSRAVTPVILQAVFGNGYVQRARDGINNIPEAWDVSYDDLEDDDANTLEAFFEGLGGVDPFTWDPNPKGVTANYVATEWARSFDEEGKNGLKVKFTRFYG